MILLAGNPEGKKAKIAKDLGLGCMVCTSRPKHLAGPRHGTFPYLAVDNGAFGCWKSGNQFNGALFLENVRRAKRFNPLFVVCPDIVCGGIASLDFSLWWRPRIDYDRVALVVQDGLWPRDVVPHLRHFRYVFVGGSVKWKWRTLAMWVDMAHSVGLPIHVGQCGQLEMLKTAHKHRVDSVDSTSWVVNSSWHIVKNYQQWVITDE